MPPQALKVVLYDDTCRPSGRVGLTHSWIAGVGLYRALGRIDTGFAVRSWTDAIDRLLAFDAPLAEVQYWGHGKWGRAFVDRDVLDRSAFSPGHALHGRLLELRERMGVDSRFWFRTCETLGANVGQNFAREWTDFFGHEVAGHTYIIGPWQSGLHRLRPGEAPTWSPAEGLAEGTADAPQKAKWSGPREPQTITCLQNTIPKTWR